MQLHEYLSQPNRRAADLAKRLGVSSAVIYQWRVGKRPVPLEYCAPLEMETGGAVSRKELRPDDWHRIWPELAAAGAAAKETAAEPAGEHAHG